MGLKVIKKKKTPRYIGPRGVRTPGSHFKMLITQPIGKKNQNGLRTSLVGPE